MVKSHMNPVGLELMTSSSNQLLGEKEVLLLSYN